MSSTLETNSVETTTHFVPVSFDEALKLYALRSTDREGWESRDSIENAYWLIKTLSERLYQEQTFSAQLIQMTRRREDDHEF